MKPIHKFNNGNGATLCHNCNIIINTGFSDELFCGDKCKAEAEAKDSDYFAELLVGAEDWAIDQIREQSKEDDERLEELSNLKELVGELLDMLETVETSDNETDFHPTVIRSCRVQHTMKLDEIMPKITEIVRGKS